MKPITLINEFRSEYEKQRSRRARRRKLESFSFYAGVFIRAAVVGAIVTFAVVQALAVIYALAMTSVL